MEQSIEKLLPSALTKSPDSTMLCCGVGVPPGGVVVGGGATVFAVNEQIDVV